jgi:hypothetical protein
MEFIIKGSPSSKKIATDYIIDSAAKEIRSSRLGRRHTD